MSMTPMNNFDHLERVKFSEELAEIEAAKKASGMTYEELAEKIGVNKVWLTSAIKGQQYVPEEYCLKLAEILGIDVDIQKDPHGDRVIITWNGKLLPYSKQGQYPW